MKRERIEEIAEILDKRGKMTLEQLEEVFPNVSQMTLRQIGRASCRERV